MTDPGTVEIYGALISGIVAIVLGYFKNNKAINLKRLDNKVVSEKLFIDELEKRDRKIDDLSGRLEKLTKNYEDQHERDLIEIESWKDKYNIEVEARTKLEKDFDGFKATIAEGALKISNT